MILEKDFTLDRGSGRGLSGWQNMQLRRMVFIHPNLAHYHFPRLQALGEVIQSGGGALYNIELASRTQAYQWVVTEKPVNFVNYTLFPGQTLEHIPSNKLWAALKHRLEAIKPDIAFLYGYSLGVLRQAKAWCDQNQVATVLISDSNDFDKQRNQIFERIKSLFVAHYGAAFVGGTSSSCYLQTLGIPQERIVAGYDVIDNAFFSRRAEENKRDLNAIRQKWFLPETYFLVVTRLIAEKNLARLFAAYQEYALQLEDTFEPWHVVICGSGPEEQKLRRLLLDFPLSLSDRILFYGYIRQPDLADFFSAATCLVLPSISETWGLVVNEALASGLPVLVTNRAGCARDLVQENQNGWTFDPYNVHELADLLARMTRLEADARMEMGQCSLQLVADWDLDRFARGALESARIALTQKQPEAQV
jgi:1,2-diacylglycerol 3-alpha-glucosyltransferase